MAEVVDEEDGAANEEEVDEETAEVDEEELVDVDEPIRKRTKPGRAGVSRDSLRMAPRPILDSQEKLLIFRHCTHYAHMLGSDLQTDRIRKAIRHTC
jgi:hypothetical protein